MEINWNILLKHLSLIGFGFIYILCFSLLASIFSTLAWLVTLNGLKQFKLFKSLFIIRNIGESLALINPFGVAVGDSFKYYLLKKHNYSSSKISFSIVITRMLSVLSFLFLSVCTIMLNVSGLDFQNAGNIKTIILITTIIFFVSVFALFFNKQLVLYKVIAKYAKLFKVKNTSFFYGLKRMNIHSIRFLYNRPLSFLFVFLLLVFHWICGAFEYMILLNYLGKEISFASAMYLEVGTSFLKNIFMFIPGQIGVEEYSVRFFLMQIGISDNDSWVTVNVLRRARQVLWLFSSLFLYLFYYKFKFVFMQTKINEYTNGGLIH